MNHRALVAAGAFAALALAGCGGDSEPAPTSTSPVAASTSSTTPSAAPEWSAEAVRACRTFTNSAPDISLVKSQIRQYKPTMTEQELSLARTGWGLATANTALPANIGIDAEPEVRQALVAVVVALDTSITDPDYVKINATAYSKAIELCEAVTG